MNIKKVEVMRGDEDARGSSGKRGGGGSGGGREQGKGSRGKGEGEFAESHHPELPSRK